MDLSALQSAYPWFKPLLVRFRAHLDAEDRSRDSAHDLSHSLRVARLAHRISEAEGSTIWYGFPRTTRTRNVQLK